MNAEQKVLSDDDLEDMYTSYLRSAYGDVEICGQTFDAADALKEMDPTGYRVDCADYADTLDPEPWVCGACNEERDDEDDAEKCCK